MCGYVRPVELARAWRAAARRRPTGERIDRSGAGDRRRQRDLAHARSVRWHTAYSADGLFGCRQHIADVLGAWGSTRLIFETQLLTTELVTNAAVHAGASTVPVRMLRTRRTVRVEVQDDDRFTLPSMEPFDRLDVTGLGLHVVTTAAPHWGCTVDRHGKTMWFELER
jgi:hypothetical protein